MNIPRVTHLWVCLVFVFGAVGCKPAPPVETAARYFSDSLPNGQAAPLLVVVPSGKGTMGGNNFGPFQNEEPVHQVTVSAPFAIGAHEVTFAEFDFYCQSAEVYCPDDEGWGRGQQPVINVSWHNAVGYARWLSSETGKTYRLPSEMEWEYAARAGTDTKFWWGDEYKGGVDHCDQNSDQCPAGTDLARPAPVGRFEVNPFGLYDVTSNVSEWVLDCYQPDHNSASRLGRAQGVDGCPDRVMKGANWSRKQPYVHLSARFSVDSNDRYPSLGFRILRELDANEIQELSKQ